MTSAPSDSFGLARFRVVTAIQRLMNFCVRLRDGLDRPTVLVPESHRSKVDVGALMRIASVLAAASVLATALFGAPAARAAEPHAEIVAPVNGSTLTQGWRGPVTINFVGSAPAGQLRLVVQCFDENWDETWLETEWFYWSGTSGTKTFETFSTTPVGDTCDVRLFDPNGVWDTENSIFLEDAAPQIRNLRASPSEFYPRVRDGYRDAVQLSFGARADTSKTMRVTNAEGRTVYSKTLRACRWCDLDYYRESIAWRGVNNAGNTVPVGRYRVAITSEPADGQAATASQRVTVKTAVVTKRKRIWRDGYYTSGHSRSRNCGVQWWEYDLTVDLDCWGGKGAEVRYFFKLPRSAKKIGWSAPGSFNSNLGGRIVKDGKRVRPTRFMIKVRVTKFRDYTVNYAHLAYTYKRRI